MGMKDYFWAERTEQDDGGKLSNKFPKTHLQAEPKRISFPKGNPRERKNSKRTQYRLKHYTQVC